MACNLERFSDRVMNIENYDRAFCRCCGRVIAYPNTGEIAAGEFDGECRRCALGHPVRVQVERPRLFA